MDEPNVLILESDVYNAGTETEITGWKIMIFQKPIHTTHTTHTTNHTSSDGSSNKPSG